jgi:hypothetical protein
MLFAPLAANARQVSGTAQQTAATADLSGTSTRPTITFTFSREVAGAPVPHYKLTVRDDGSGSYEGEAVPPPTRYGPAASSAALPFQRNLRLTSATTARLFDLAAQLDHFNRVCASKAKNIADTGTKTLTYAGPDGAGSCTYNYTEVKDLAAMTQLIQGIAQTLDEGRELDRLHRYDRLGLDAAMTFLQQESQEGRALDLETISDSLRAIADDNDVLARVRAKASAMLAQIERDAAR